MLDRVNLSDEATLIPDADQITGVSIVLRYPAVLREGIQSDDLRRRMYTAWIEQACPLFAKAIAEDAPIRSLAAIVRELA